jgi:hypothetical protein
MDGSILQLASSAVVVAQAREPQRVSRSTDR